MTHRTSSPEWMLERICGSHRSREFWRFRTETGTVSFGDFFVGLHQSSSVREALLDAWAHTPFLGFFWELPPLTLEVRSLPFECALIEAPELHGRRASSAAFSRQLDPALAASVFPNLGKDAILVAPSFEPAPACGHLGDFARHAPRAQCHAVLAILAQVVIDSCTKSPLWVNTSGSGVPWLHFRLDSYPKYYQCHRYRTYPSRAIP